jgi:hypothetical protein
MKLHREDVVAQLRDMGRDEEADRAERDLPERFSEKEYEGRLRSYGLGVKPFDPDGGGVYWSTTHGAL